MPTGKPGTGRPRERDRNRKQHVANGKPKGGPQPGSGRPKGSLGLPMNAIPAIESLKLRAPKDITEEQKTVLKQTEDAIVKVMAGKVHGSIAGAVLLAARTIREEICGPIAKQVNVEAKLGIGKLLDEVKTIEEKEVPTLPEAPRAVEPKGPIIRRKAAGAVLGAALSVVADTDETADQVEKAAGTPEEGQ